MRAVVQRIKNGTVAIKGRIKGQIAKGLLVYLGVGKSDDYKDVHYLVDKVINLRIFEDKEGKMNISLKQIGGQILVISQFTLYGDVRKGRRPSYSNAAVPITAEKLYKQFILELQKQGFVVASGEFGAMMDVSYTNYGPVTILLDSEKVF